MSKAEFHNLFILITSFVDSAVLNVNARIYLFSNIDAYYKYIYLSAWIESANNFTDGVKLTDVHSNAKLSQNISRII